jgi:hypothetical protein
VSAPTLAEFVRHAELFGSECVFETAEHCLDERELRHLRIELDTIEAERIEAERRRGRYRVGRKRRRTRAESQAAIQFLLDEGLTRGEVAGKLGLSLRTMDFYLTPNERRMTADLTSRIRRHKTPANEEVKKPEIGSPGLSGGPSATRAEETGQMTLEESA